MADELLTFKSILRLRNRISYGELESGVEVDLADVVVSVLDDKSRVLLTDANMYGVWSDVSPEHPIVNTDGNPISVRGKYFRNATDGEADNFEINYINY